MGIRKLLVALSIAALGVGGSAAPAGASHSWGGYHWARTANPFTLKVGDNVSTAWDSYLGTAATDWSKDTAGNPVNLNVVAGATKPRSCQAKTGHIEVCAARYGYNGWLGLAQIWVTSDLHITKGTAKMNDTYYSLPQYNTPIWRGVVMCQEIGHTFGLDHQDTSGANLHTCMDYATDPDSANTHPNYHDYEELAIIYSHLDSTTTIAAASRGAASTRVVSTKRVNNSTIVKRFADGSRLITFIVWAR